MTVVVIGFGSIGKRHVKNLISLGVNDIILCRTKTIGNEYNLQEINNLVDIIKINPDFVIVTNPTALHYKVLKFLVKNNINILCEKPLIFKENEWQNLKVKLDNYTGIDKVVFNLRLHPCIKKVKKILQENRLGKINYARFFVGQYLPDWRPNSNHLESYSAQKEMGGGVVLDLVHEVDLAEYLLGKPKKQVQHITEKIANVTVNAVDVSEIIYKSENNNIINIHLDYLYRGYARHFLINGANFNLHCDLFKNTITITGDKNEIIENISFNSFERNDMYVEVLQEYLKAIKKEKNLLPSFTENESVMATCFKINC